MTVMQKNAPQAQGMIYPYFALNHADHRPGVFWGYASTYTLDKVRDIMMPGAFAASLDHWQKVQGHWPNVYLEHDLYAMIGVCDDLREDAKGLYVQGRLLPEIPAARKAYALLKKGMRGLSIGFQVVHAEHHKGQRLIHQVALKEISLVHNPCNPLAHVHEYKNTFSRIHPLVPVADACGPSTVNTPDGKVWRDPCVHAPPLKMPLIQTDDALSQGDSQQQRLPRDGSHVDGEAYLLDALRQLRAIIITKKSHQGIKKNK